MSALSTPIEVFFSYAAEDEALCNELEKHLSVLQRQGVITLWHDRRIVPGADWLQEIDTHLNSSSIVLLLISPDFLASDYRYGAEMQRALERQRNGEVYVIPVLLRAVDFQDAPFAHLQSLPRNNKAVESWSNQDEAFYDVARGIRQVVAHLRKVDRILPLPPLPSWTASTQASSLSRTNRERMLKRIRTFWITGVLEQSLHHAALITLGLHEQPDAVASPWRLVMQEAVPPARSLPVGTRITEVYHNADGELLILGEPGAGKTTLLLELARDLLSRADQDPTHPIPVVFNLSSWAVKQQSIAAWLVEELNIKYQVPRKVGQAWIDADELLLLLDGLDEVTELQRSACIEAINAYRHEHAVPLVVCSRKAEYQAQAVRIALQSAVLIQPLSIQQIDNYLSSAGRQLEAVREALHTDPELQEITQTPLILSIVALAYQGQPVGSLQREGTTQTLHQQVFETYIQRMLQRRGFQTRYTPEQTRHWLAWLADQMRKHSQSEHYLEQMQPDWLPIGWLRRLYPWTIRLTAALGSGLLVSLILSLCAFLANPLSHGRTFSLLLVMSAGFIGGFLLGFINPIPREINPTEIILWSPSNICRSLIRSASLRGALVGGLMSGGIGAAIAYVGGSATGFGFIVVFIGVLGGTMSGFTAGVVKKTLSEHTWNESRERQQHTQRPSIWGKILFRLNMGIIVGLMAGSLLALIDAVGLSGMESSAFVKWTITAVVGLTIPLGLIAALSSMLVIRVPQEMQTMSVAGWLWTHAWSRLIRIRWVSGWLAFALLITLLIVGIYPPNLRSLVQVISFCLLLTPLFSLASGIVDEMINGLASQELEKEKHTRPNQGIWHSGRNSILIGLIFGLVGLLLFGSLSLLLGMNLPDPNFANVSFFSLFLALPGATICGVGAALLYGGTATLQHVILRLIFRSINATPKNYTHFLNYAHSRILLHKVGGGYTFVHHQFLEYFATRSWQTSPKRGLRVQLSLLITSIILLTTTVGLVSSDTLSRYYYGNASSPEARMKANPYPSYLPGNGTLILSDPLSSPKAWSPRSNTFGGQCQFVNGAYQVTLSVLQKFFTCYGDNPYTNFAFEVKMRIKQGDCGGLQMRSDTAQFYLFMVCQDGRYYFSKYLSSQEGSDLLRITRGNTSATKQGTDLLNTIAVHADGSQFDLYINTQKIATVTDGSYSAGILGLVAGAANNTTTVTYQDARVWAISPQNVSLPETVMKANPYPSYLPGNGTLVHSDPPSSPDAWDFHPIITGGRCQFVNGAYQITLSAQKKVFTCYQHNMYSYSNFAFEVKMTIKQGDCGGLEIRSNYTQFYLFMVCQDGKYYFHKYLSRQGGSNAPRITGGNTSVIKQGTGQLNVIAVRANGNYLDLYINTQKITTVINDSYSQGVLGLVAGAGDNSTTVTYQDVRVWTI